MNLLEEPWIPVRANHGTGEFQLLTYKALLCDTGLDWQISLPRDDLELACLQLLVCMTQAMFLPEDDGDLRARIEQPLTPEAFDTGIAPYRDWFDLDHPTQPFMQIPGTKGEWTSVQKLLPGLPEKTSKSEMAHCFFNEVSEVQCVSGTVAAIALFNQASNSPSFGGGPGGGFKGGLRGNAPITTLVFDGDMRRMVWRNVLTRLRLAERQIAAPGPTYDKPTWVVPIAEKSTIHWNQIGLIRGLFWQPAHIALIRTSESKVCDLLGNSVAASYCGFLRKPFGYVVEGIWPHPHGAMSTNFKKGLPEQRFVTFSTTAPAWTQLCEFVIPRNVQGQGVTQGFSPAGPIVQAESVGDKRLDIVIGGYSANQASVLERRHELISLPQGWGDDKDRLSRLVTVGSRARDSLLDAIFSSALGMPGMKGLGLARKKKGRKRIKSREDAQGFHEYAEKVFYARTENLIHATFSNEATFREWGEKRREFTRQIVQTCRDIFEELTQPYAMKPELIPIIAWSRRALNNDLKKLTEEAA